MPIWEDTKNVVSILVVITVDLWKYYGDCFSQFWES